MESGNANSLTALLDKLGDDSNGDPVELGELVSAFRYRGFGPLLLIPALLTILPTGAIPGVPAICGVLMAFISIQIVFGREHPWLPQKLKMFSVRKEKLQNAVKKIKPYTQKADHYLQRRLEILTTKTSQRLVGLIIFLISLFIILIGFIPFLPALFALPVFFFALGYSARDGLIIAIGLFFVALAGLWAPLLFSGD